MHQSVMEFFGTNLDLGEVHEKRVLEVGSYNVNGSVRSIIKPMQPLEYLGIDMRPGPDVDLVCDITRDVVPLPQDQEPWDVVVCAEMLEHVDDWRVAVYRLKDLLSPTGTLFITTRSWGFPLHEYPGDFWRYELGDMEKIFSDMEIVSLIRDPQVPGVFLKARPKAEWGDAARRFPLEHITVRSQPGGR